MVRRVEGRTVLQRACERENIPLHIAHFDTKEYADLHKVSIEMAARDLRYKYFFQLKDDLQAAAICVGHHKEDSVETILINLLRGTGLSGMMGISPDATVSFVLCSPSHVRRLSNILKNEK